MPASDVELAEAVALAAGRVLVAAARGPAEGVSSKSSATDMVSDADRAAEATIRDLLQRERPHDGLLAEEGSRAESESGRRWIVDPLDGTTNYLYGHPSWCVSVALEDRDGLLAGVVHSPRHGETFRAERGGGAWLGGRQLAVRDHGDLATALIATGFGYDAAVRAAQADTLRRVLPAVRDIRRDGAAALDLAWLAAGRLDGYYERGLNPWDWAAGSLLVSEAGGRLIELPPTAEARAAPARAALAAELPPPAEPRAERGTASARPGLVAAGPRLAEALAELVA